MEPRIAYIKLFLDYLDAIEPLGDAERGRLFTSLLEYARTGEAGHLSGNERFIFPMMRAQIDRDRAAFEDSAAALREQRRKAGSSGGKASAAKRKQTRQSEANQANSSEPNQTQQTEANEANSSEPERTQPKQAKEKDKDKEEDKDDKNPPFPPLGGSASLQAAYDRWLAYKLEKRQAYKPQGRKALEAQLLRAAERYGAEAVAALIDECMASNWQGIIFERLERKDSARKSGQEWRFEDL